MLLSYWKNLGKWTTNTWFCFSPKLSREKSVGNPEKSMEDNIKIHFKCSGLECRMDSASL
jgi:hypothetical protein